MISFKEWRKFKESTKDKKGQILDALAKIRGAQRANIDWQSQPRSKTITPDHKDPQKERRSAKNKLNRGDYD
jgi:hypothetical protein